MPMPTEAVDMTRENILPPTFRRDYHREQYPQGEQFFVEIVHHPYPKGDKEKNKCTMGEKPKI